MAKPKILLIQGAQTQGNGTKRFLEDKGHKVVWAGSGMTGLMMARNVTVDLIVLDVALPDTDGLEICRRFRLHEETASIPIILLTTRGYKPPQTLRTSMGPDAYLEKPCTGSDLDSLISTVLNRSTVEVPAKKAEPEPQPLQQRMPEPPVGPSVLPEPLPALITTMQQAPQPLPLPEPAMPQQEVAMAARPVVPPAPMHAPTVQAKAEEAAPQTAASTAPAPAQEPTPAPLLPLPATGDAVIDAATGLFGKPQFEAMFSKEFKKAVRFKQALSCMLIDLDGRKVNRRADGELVKAIIGLVQKTIREVDTAAWWSGESLIVLLPNTMRRDALQAAARILEAVAVHPFTWPDATNVTISVGVAGLPDGSLDSEQKLIEAADTARSRAQDLMTPSPDHAKYLKR